MKEGVVEVRKAENTGLESQLKQQNEQPEQGEQAEQHPRDSQTQQQQLPLTLSSSSRAEEISPRGSGPLRVSKGSDRGARPRMALRPRGTNELRDCGEPI